MSPRTILGKNVFFKRAIQFYFSRSFSPIGTHLAEVVVAEEAAEPVAVASYRPHHGAVFGVATGTGSLRFGLFQNCV